MTNAQVQIDITARTPAARALDSLAQSITKASAANKNATEAEKAYAAALEKRVKSMATANQLQSDLKKHQDAVRAELVRRGVLPPPDDRHPDLLRMKPGAAAAGEAAGVGKALKVAAVVVALQKSLETASKATDTWSNSQLTAAQKV